MSTQALKRKLSESANGDGILITAIAPTGTLIHTSVASAIAGVYDEIWIWAYNDSTAAITLTVEYGSTSFLVSVPYRCGLVPIIPGLLLQNSATISAYASVASVVTLSGFVHTLSDT